MFDKNDPRANLATMKASTASIPLYAAADYGKFYEVPANEVSEFTSTWWMRGQNFFIAYSEVQDGGVFHRKDQIDEYVLILPDKETKVTVKWADTETEVDGYSIVIIPPGESEITFMKGGKATRLFSYENADLEDLPLNKASYTEPNPSVTLLKPWPKPVDGYKVRAYSLDVPKEEGRFGRIFRCSTFMVNFLDPSDGPRDPSKMSPHSHDDFEQCSLALEGEFVHHLRWPWTTNMADWRPDEHELCGSPSVTIIPPGVIHTTQATGSGINQLVDIFSPPREDFSLQDGWVLNADDYPMPK